MRKPPSKLNLDDAQAMGIIRDRLSTEYIKLYGTLGIFDSVRYQLKKNYEQQALLLSILTRESYRISSVMRDWEES